MASVADGLEFARSVGAFDPNEGTVAVGELAEGRRFLIPGGSTEGVVVTTLDAGTGRVAVKIDAGPVASSHRVPITVGGNLRVKPLPRFA